MTPEQRQAADAGEVVARLQSNCDNLQQEVADLRAENRTLRNACAEGWSEPAEIERPPLTEAQIKAIWWQCEAALRNSDPRHEWWSTFARAIERAHGIGGKE